VKAVVYPGYGATPVLVCPRQTQPGFTGPGSFAELVAVHPADANLVALPADLDFVTAACLGCRFATAFRAVTAHGRVRPGDWLAWSRCQREQREDRRRCRAPAGCPAPRPAGRG